MPTLLKHLQNIKEDGTLPGSFHEASTSPIPSPDKDTMRKENKGPTSLMTTAAKPSIKS
jgi:hypothetical protein